MIRLGSFDVQTIRTGTLRLDGGSMFGIVPRPVWEKGSPPDARNRIHLVTRSLLVRTGEGAVLVETGCGDRWSDKERDRYGIEAPGLAEALTEAGVDPASVDHVTFSHLHWDHAGGAVVRNDAGGLVPALPGALYWVHRGEWDHACRPPVRGAASYRPDDFRPLETSGRLRFLPPSGRIVPGVTVEVTGGHIPFHVLVRVTSENETLILPGDLMPTAQHCHPASSMAYDADPVRTADVKIAMLREAAEKGWLVVPDHDPDIDIGRIQAVDPARDRYSLVPA